MGEVTATIKELSTDDNQPILQLELTKDGIVNSRIERPPEIMRIMYESLKEHFEEPK